MNRLFHAKISFVNYVLLSALLAVAIYFVWQAPTISRQLLGIVICVILLLMVIIVERMINTTYTITADGKILIHEGRFGKDLTVDINDINKITLKDRINIFGLSIYSYLLIETNDGNRIKVSPNNKKDFIHKVEKIQKSNTIDEDDEED